MLIADDVEANLIALEAALDQVDCENGIQAIIGEGDVEVNLFGHHLQGCGHFLHLLQLDLGFLPGIGVGIAVFLSGLDRLRCLTVLDQQSRSQAQCYDG